MKYDVKLIKASELLKMKTTASGIRDGFDNGELPLYYHSYKPDNSFVAVPPELLIELAEKANEIGLMKELNAKVKKTFDEKAKIIRQIKATKRK